MYELTQTIEFNAGHRLSFHEGKCNNLHGHRYKVAVTIQAEKLKEEGSEKGMVLDLGTLKKIMMEKIHDELDHTFLWYEEDEIFENMQKTDLFKVGRSFPYVPTAENITKWCYEQLKDELDTSDYWIKSITVWETPNSSATYYPNNKDKIIDKEQRTLNGFITEQLCGEEEKC